MAMHNPPHPGEFIIQVYLDPNNLSGRELAGKLGVAASTLNRILREENLEKKRGQATFQYHLSLSGPLKSSLSPFLSPPLTLPSQLDR